MRERELYEYLIRRAFLLVECIPAVIRMRFGVLVHGREAISQSRANSYESNCPRNEARNCPAPGFLLGPFGHHESEQTITRSSLNGSLSTQSLTVEQNI
eukprot:scaffold117634_cov16-Prasinocladus_malaysianus.AAC.1